MVEQLGTDLGRMLGPADSNAGSGPVAAVSPRYPAPEATSAGSMDGSRSSPASDSHSDFRRILDDRMRQDAPASEESGDDGQHDDRVVHARDTATQDERRSKAVKDTETGGQAGAAGGQVADQVTQPRAKTQSTKSAAARSTNAGTTGASSACRGVGAGAASAAFGTSEAAKPSISALKNAVADANSAGPHVSKGDRNGVSKAGGATQSGAKTSAATANAKSDADTGRIVTGTEQDARTVRADPSATRPDPDATSASGQTQRGQTTTQEVKTPGGSPTEASRDASAETPDKAGRLPTADRVAGADESLGSRAVHATANRPVGFGIHRGRGVARGHNHRRSGGSDHGTDGGHASKRSTGMTESIGQLDVRKRDGSGGAGSIDTGSGGLERTEASAMDAGSASAADRIAAVTGPAARTAGDATSEPVAGPVMGRSGGTTAPEAAHQQLADRLLETPVTPGRQIEITLTPPELGRVRMRFAEIDGQIHGQLEVQNAQTRQQIERHISEVLAVLQNQGVQVRRIEVMPEPPAPQDQPQPGRDQGDPGSLPFDEAPPDGGQSASGDGRRSSSQTASDPTWNETAAERAPQTQQYTEDRVNLYA